jgi:hypothetical protein
LADRVESTEIDAQGSQAILDHPVVFGLVAHLSGEPKLHIHLRSALDPPGCQLSRLHLVPEGYLQQVPDVKSAAAFHHQRLRRLEPAQELVVLLLQLFDERARFHRSRLLLH